MQMHWYVWMTDWMLGHYLSSRTYYDIASRDDVDNPDERIQENVEPLVQTVTGFPAQLLNNILAIITGGILLSQVNKNMTVFVVIYSLIAFAFEAAIAWPLIRKNFDMVAANADFRFGLLRVRENAEPIAFFRGEQMERDQINSRLDRVVKKRLDIFYYTAKTGVLNVILQEIWTIAPLFFIYPLYFTGKIQFGTIALSTAAAAQLRGSLTSFNSYLPMLAGVAPRVVRLSQIVERFDTMYAQNNGADQHIAIKRGDSIELDHVSFQTPGGEQQLASDVSLSIPRGGSLIIIGETGVGKSSILRSMAGLWTRGSGTMTMPPEAVSMFVPQRPYMMLGTLRSQLLYPNGDADMTEEAFQAVLERVRLPDLIRHSGGIDANLDWSRVLSLGEQQRISFARILISRPQFVFMDESTSAVDIPTEAVLHRELIATGATFVSVGHRETLLGFHERALRLLPGGGWEIVEAKSVERSAVQPLGSLRQNVGTES